MYQFSDSDSRDSDQGIRFKTDVTRNKRDKRDISSSLDKAKSRRRSRSRSRSRSPKNREKSNRSTKLNNRKEERSSSSRESCTRRHSEKKGEQSRVMGPALAPQFLVAEEVNSTNIASSVKLQETQVAQTSSTNLRKLPDPAVMGPVLPPNLKRKTLISPEFPQLLNMTTDKAVSSSSIGPELPPHLRDKFQLNSDSDSEGDVYGPLPIDEMTYSKPQIALEERALQLKIDQLEPCPSVPVREEWMLELPEAKASRFGLGPRQFRSKPGPDMSDRSSWTNTPNKKTKSAEVDLKKVAESEGIEKRNEEQSKISKKLKKHKESLLDLHQKKMKEKKEKKEEGERRPFSRDIDLQVNRFDEAQKKAILKKAQLLDDRFSSGQSKFL